MVHSIFNLPFLQLQNDSDKLQVVATEAENIVKLTVPMF